MTWVAMALMGSAGALLRWRAGLRWATEGILAVNLSGAFALGFLNGAGVHGAALMIAGTGFLGAYTTFSTWMVERRYIAVSIVCGLLAACAGWLLGSLL